MRGQHYKSLLARDIPEEPKAEEGTSWPPMVAKRPAPVRHEEDLLEST